MTPIEFRGHNVVMAKNQKQYRPLPAYRSQDGRVLSVWQLTWRERWAVLLYGKLFIQSMTFGQALQPILPTVEPENVGLERVRGGTVRVQTEAENGRSFRP